MAKGPGGRPETYTPELGDLVCAGLAEKTPLARLCRENDALPTPKTVYGWLRNHEEFLLNYTRAKEDQADYLVEECLEIADDEAIDPANKRIMVDTRKWIAAKYRHKKYGDKVQQDIEIKSLDSVTDADIANRVAELLAKSK